MCRPGAIGHSLNQAGSGGSCPGGVAAAAANLIRLTLPSVHWVMQTVTTALKGIGKVRNCSLAGGGAVHL